MTVEIHLPRLRPGVEAGQSVGGYGEAPGPAAQVGAVNLGARETGEAGGEGKVKYLVAVAFCICVAGVIAAIFYYCVLPDIMQMAVESAVANS